MKSTYVATVATVVFASGAFAASCTAGSKKCVPYDPTAYEYCVNGGLVVAPCMPLGYHCKQLGDGVATCVAPPSSSSAASSITDMSSSSGISTSQPITSVSSPASVSVSNSGSESRSESASGSRSDSVSASGSHSVSASGSDSVSASGSRSDSVSGSVTGSASDGTTTPCTECHHSSTDTCDDNTSTSTGCTKTVYVTADCGCSAGGSTIVPTQTGSPLPPSNSTTHTTVAPFKGDASSFGMSGVVVGIMAVVAGLIGMF